jgi:hypothetical protein
MIALAAVIASRPVGVELSAPTMIPLRRSGRVETTDTPHPRQTSKANRRDKEALGFPAGL